MKNNIRIASLALIIALFPTTVLSAGSLKADDSVAGIGAEVTISGFAPNAQDDLVLRPPSGNLAAFPVTLDAQGSAKFHIPATSTGKAGTYSVFLGSQGTRISGDVSFTVLADVTDADTSSLSASKDAIDADGQDASTVSVTLRDHYGNPLSGRPVELVLSQPKAKSNPLTSETDSTGTQKFSVTSAQPGSIVVRALDILSDTQLSSQTTIDIGGGAVGGPTNGTDLIASGTDYVPPQRTSPFLADVAATTTGGIGVLQGFEITVDPATLQVNEQGNLTIRAINVNGATVQDYSGTVEISSPTDPSANLPGFGSNPNQGSVTFLPKNLGQKYMPLSVSFSQPGNQTLLVTDTTDPAHPISSKVTVNVTGSTTAKSQHRIVISSPQPDSTVGTAPVTIEGNDIPYTNISVAGGTDKVTGDTDSTGHFSISVPLDPSYNEYTLQITDSQGSDASLHLIRDTEPPALRSATFAPEKPKQGEMTLLVVQSEPGLASVSMNLSGEDLALKEDTTKLGTYQLLFSAPKAGDYQPTITATDAAGNEMQMRVLLTTVSPSLPIAQNLQAQPFTGAVNLTWDPITTDTIDKFRVYVGDHEGDFAYTIDTKSATPGARVTGLQANTTYYFAVTTIKGDLESDKSAVVTARPAGLSLTVTPDTQALNLAWSFSSNTSVASFEIDYGVDANNLTEKRAMAGGDMQADEARNLTLRDLLPGIPYYVTVTPIDVKGKALTDLIAKGQGTPLSPNGFHPSPSEPSPVFPAGIPPSLSGLLSSIPSVTSSGLSDGVWWITAGIVILVAAFLWQRRRSKRMTQQFLRTMEARYRGS